MSMYSGLKNTLSERSQGLVPATGPTRYQLVLLHSLVTIVLCYQLLFSQAPLLPVLVLDLIAVGLLATIATLVLLPIRLLGARWLVPVLVMADTGLTIASIYLSGNASSNLYVTFFLIMLIAAFAPTLQQMIGLSTLLCTAYGAVLYLESDTLGKLSESHLLQIPILLILGIFYGIANDAARKLNRDNIVLTEHMNARQQEEKALRASEQRVRLVLENALDAFIMMNVSGCIVEWNRQAETLFGWTRDEAVGRRLSDTIIPSRYREAHERGLQQFRATGGGRVLNTRIEIEALHRDGHLLPVELRVSPIQLDGSTAFTAFLSDISERKRLEEQVRHSQKMEAVGQLAGGVAHDFNNMLLIIGGYSDLLADDPSLTEEQRRGIQQIGQATERAAALTSQLLAFSRRQVLQPKVMNLNVIVSSLEQMLRTLLGESIEFATVLDSSLGCVKADPGQIEQVVINLCLNARDAMPQGGRLIILTDSVYLDEAATRQHRLDGNPGFHMRLVVRDTGIGMDPQTLSHIFEPFFTTKPKGKGTGLGLASVYGIIKQSGGAITVASEPGKGTSVTIYLPGVEEPASINGTDSDVPAALTGAETVLVVEDEPDVRGLVCRSLRKQGYTVLEARHGIEALMIADRRVGPIHLVLTDIVMPQMNGREVAEHLMSKYAEMKVLLMSGYTDDAILRQGVVTAAVNFLQKPFTPNALASKVRQVLDANQESLVH